MIQPLVTVAFLSCLSTELSVGSLIRFSLYPILTHRHDDKNGEKSSRGAGDVGVAAVGQQDGRIVLVSTVFFEFDHLKGIALRLNVDGSLDTSFNQKGFVLVELPGITHRWNYAAGVAVQQDGKVLVCGDFSREACDEFPDAYVIRYDQDGKVDASFGDKKNGVVTITDSSRWLDLGSMTLKSDGGVVAVGTADHDGDREGLIVSLNPSGSFNLVFNNGKPLFSSFTEHGVSWRRCVLQTDGKLVFSGQGGGALVNENSSVVTARYKSDGSQDVKFAGKGWAVFNSESGIDMFRGCAVMADNRVVVSGYVSFAPSSTSSGICTALPRLRWSVRPSWIHRGQARSHREYLNPVGAWLGPGGVPTILLGLAELRSQFAQQGFSFKHFSDYIVSFFAAQANAFQQCVGDVFIRAGADAAGA